MGDTICELCGKHVHGSDAATLPKYDLGEFEKLSPVDPAELFPYFETARKEELRSGDLPVCYTCWKLVHEVVWPESPAAFQRAISRLKSMSDSDESDEDSQGKVVQSRPKSVGEKPRCRRSRA